MRYMETKIIFVCPSCIVCGHREEILLDLDKFTRWQAGEFIQHVFPELSDTQREQMMTGFCEKCWDETFREV